jgi:hypothetical protein
MVSKLLCFAWFDFGLIPRLWNEKIENLNFWNESLNDLIRCDGEGGIHFLIKPELLKKYYEQKEIIKMFKENNEHKWELLETGVGAEIIEYYNNIKTNTFDLPTAKDFFRKFIREIQYNKQFILFAQRDYINSTFADFNQMDEIEDTNVPWDWDHIYPSEWVYNMKNCSKSIRDWNGTNGNFRAISLEHNRSRSNQQSPKDISDDIEREYSFIQENDWQYWKNIDNRIWDNEKQNHFRAITTRMINIYGKFWNDLKINELIIEKQ